VGALILGRRADRAEDHGRALAHGGGLLAHGADHVAHGGVDLLFHGPAIELLDEQRANLLIAQARHQLADRLGRQRLRQLDRGRRRLRLGRVLGVDGSREPGKHQRGDH